MFGSPGTLQALRSLNLKIPAMLKMQFVRWMEHESPAPESESKCLREERAAMKAAEEEIEEGQEEMIVVEHVVTGRDPDRHEDDHLLLGAQGRRVLTPAQNHVKGVKLPDINKRPRAVFICRQRFFIL